jgi:LuxR family maltose regulon positive regulatory protein
MAAAILDTKLVPTFVSRRLLTRDHLVRKLVDAAHARLIVVHGEAGAGKSTLLFEFSLQAFQPVGWYSLQETDREPRVFLTYLFEALQRLSPTCINQSRDMLAQWSGDLADAERVLVSLLNDSASYGRPLALVLDDYHLVADTEQVHSMVSFMVRNGPANLTLILATRNAPALPLPYLRAKGLLAEIGPDDLRFSVDEVQRVFSETWRLKIDRSLAAMLWEKTEGWVTALQLVSQAVQGRDAEGVRSYIEHLEGQERFIYDYLATEVYDLHPQEVKCFLKATSIVSSFNCDLARVLSDAADTESMIEYLEASRLFLVHLDSTRQWFRYHHLFGDFLRRKLQIEDGADEVERLHTVAARWFDANSETASATEHFIEARDYESAMGVLERSGSDMLAAGLQKSVHRWLGELPATIREHRAGLLVLQGQLCELYGEWARAVDFYERAIASYRREGRHSDVSNVLESLFVCYVKYGEIDRVLATCESELDKCGPEGSSARASLSARLGAMLLISGRDWERGYRLVESSHTLAYKSGDPRAIAWACVMYGFCYHFTQGNFSHALEAFNEGIEMFRSLGWSPMLYQLLMNKCVVQIFQGDIPRANDLLEDTIAVAHRAGHAFVVQGLEMSRAMISLARADFNRCREALERLQDRMVPTQLKPWYYRTQLLMHLRQRNFQQARVAGHEMMRALDSAGRGMYAPECLIAYGLLCAHNDPVGAERCHREALALCEQARSRFWRMKALMALAALHLGEAPEAAELSEALRLARENDYGRSWHNDAHGLALTLLLHAISTGIEVTTARDILAGWDSGLHDQLLPFATHADPRMRDVALEYLVQPNEADEANPFGLRASARPRGKRQVNGKQPLQPDAYRVKIDIRTFGNLEVLRNGEPLDLKRRSTIRVFKYLLARYDAVVSMDELMEEFWPDLDPERARRNVIVHVNYLRKMLHPESPHSKFLVVMSAQGYRLELGSDVWLDVEELERLIAEGQALYREGGMPSALARFLRADALYRAPFLDNDVNEEWWLKTRRDRVAQAYRDMVFLLAQHCLEEQNVREATSWYQRQLDRDPLDELALQHLLRCFALLKDRTSAHRSFETFSEKLRRDLELEPSSETRYLLSHVNG